MLPLHGRLQSKCITHRSSAPLKLTHRLQNITNQPLFGNGTVPDICDDYIQLYNTTLTTGIATLPVPVLGDVIVQPPFFPSARQWHGVWGLRQDVAWVDRPGIPCEQLA